MKLSLEYFWGSKKEAAWIMWLHFLLLSFFQSFVIGKRLYLHHTLIVLCCTEAKWLKKKKNKQKTHQHKETI